MKIFDTIKAFLGGILNGKTADHTNGNTKKTEPYVYVTTNGKKFHYDLLCPGIRNSKEYKMPLSKARKAGYKACDKCCYSYLHK